MSSNATIGDLTVGLFLDIKPFGESVKAALNILTIFNKDATALTQLKPIKPNLSGIDAEITKLDSTIKKYSEDTLRAAQSQKQFDKSAAESSATTVKLRDNFSNLGLRVMGFQQALSILKGTLGGLLTEYGKQDVADAKLMNGLKNVGEGVEAFNRLTSQASEKQKITPFGDDEIQNAQAMLTTFKKSSEVIDLLTPRILDMSAAFMKTGDTSMDLQTVAVMLGKIDETTMGALKRYGVKFTEAQEQMLKSTEGLEQAKVLAEILDQNFKGMAETVGTTAPGQMKIFENKIGEVKEGMGKLVSGGLLPVLAPLSAILDWMQKAPPWVQTLTVGIIALGSAFIILGSSLGGVPYIIGGIITAIAAAYIAVKGLGTSFDENKTKVNELKAEYDKAAEGINGLKVIQSELSSNNIRTSQEQEELNNKIRDAVKVYPDLVTGINSQTGALETNAEQINKVIDSQEKLNKMREDLLVSQQVKTIKDLIDEHKNEIVIQNQITDALKNNGKELNNNRIQYGKFGDVVTIVYDVDKATEKLKGRLIESNNATAKLKVEMIDMIQEGLKIGNIDKVLAGLKASIGNTGDTAKWFFGMIAELTGQAVNNWDDVTNAVNRLQGAMNTVQMVGPQPLTFGTYKEDLKNKIKGIDSEIDATLKADETGRKKLVEQRKKFQDELDKAEGKNQSKGTGKKKESPTDEIQDMEKQIKEAEKELSLLEKNNHKYVAGTNELTLAYRNQTKSIEDLKKKLAELKGGFIAVSDEDAKKMLKSAFEQVDVLNKETAEKKKAYDEINFKKQTAYEEMLSELRINLYGDELDKIAKDYEKKRMEAIANIPADKQKEILSLLMEEQIQKENEVRVKRIAAYYDGIVTDLQSAVSFADAISSRLGEGGKNFFNFIKAALQIAMQIAKLEKKSSSGESFGVEDALGFLGSIASFFLMFNEGGIVPGVGDSDTVPILATPGEPIISKPRTKQLTAMFGQEFIPWLLGGSVYVNTAGRYNAGGVVSNLGSGGGEIQLITEGELSELLAQKVIIKGMPGFKIREAKRSLKG